MHVIVRARLLTPVAVHALGDRIPLDAVLLAAKGNRDGVSPGMEERLPLRKRRFRDESGSEEWFHLCSDAFFVNPRPWLATTRRFLDGHLMAQHCQPASFDTGSGAFRLFDLRRMAVAAREAVWTAETDDIKELEDLLAFADFIGAWTSKGFGEVAEWKVDPLPGQWSPAAKGTVLRGLPVPAARDLGIDVSASPLDVRSWRPPYYRTPRGACVVPASRMDVGAPGWEGLTPLAAGG